MRIFRFFEGLINIKYYKLHKNGKFGNLLQLHQWIDTFPNFAMVFLPFFNICACAFECAVLARLLTTCSHVAALNIVGS